MIDDKLKTYKMFRKSQEMSMLKLEQERKAIYKNKKKKKKNGELLRKNTLARFRLICKAVSDTFKHFNNLYYENDYYR